MFYTISNRELTVVISDLGAEIQSIKAVDGEERIWQGDPTFWARRTPICFPFCGRLFEGKATVNGKACNIPMHGFFRDREATVVAKSQTSITFRECSDEETLKNYPYHFVMDVTYTIEDNKLTQTVAVSNPNGETMYYGYGAHPAFRVPFGGAKFSDAYIKFGDKSGAHAVRFDPQNHYIIGGSSNFPLRGGNRFDLTEEFFANGATFLCDMPSQVTLASDRSHHSISFSYEGFPYLGLWKAPGAEFLCIEPWCSLPATLGQNTEFTEKKDLVKLESGKINFHTFSMTFN